MRLATAGSRLSRRWKTEDWYWEQLVDRLRAPARTGETVREYKAMTKDQRTEKKDVGGFVGGAIQGGRRVAGAVTERWLVTLDADYAEPGDWEEFTALNDVRCCVYSTHSHTPEQPKLRWVLPLRRAVSPEEYVAVARKVAEWIGIEKMDPLTYQPERLMFWPSCCEDGEYVFHEQDGPTLDPDAVLREYGDGDEWRDAWRWPVSSRESEVVQREAKQQADPLSKPGIVGAFCRVYSVEDAIDAFELPYERCAGMVNRYTYTGGTTAAGAVVYGGGRWLYSNHATDPAGGLLCNAWDLVRVHKFGGLDDGSRATDTTRLPSYLRMAELASGDPTVRAAVIDEQFGDMGRVGDGRIAPVNERTKPGVNTPKSGANDDVDRVDDEVGGDGTDDGEEKALDTQATDRIMGSEGDEADTDDGAWKDELTTDRKTGAIEPTLNNACVILSRAPQFRDRLAFCEMGEQIYVTRPMPWKRKPGLRDVGRERRIMGDGWTVGGVAEDDYHGPPRMHGRVWDEQDRIELYKLFEKLGYKAAQKTNGMLDNALINAAQEHTCDPIVDYLLGLEWDGVERLDTIFIRWLGAEDCALNREITRLWMMGAVDRAIRPGHQFESVLVFCGEQGIGKTRLLRMLAGEYFTNSVSAISSEKSIVELLQGKWIVELGELDSVKKSDSTAFKTFISKVADDYRKPYAEYSASHPRQCVFAGTTNEMAFLRDDTGERRYWVMPCAGQAGMAELGLKGTLPGFTDEVPQIWAEAVVRWRERMYEMRRGNEPIENVEMMLYLSDPTLQAEMDERLAGFKLADTIREDIEEYLDTTLPENWDDMDAQERVDFFSPYWVGDRSKCTKRRETVTLKAIRTELYKEKPEDAARGGRSNLVYRIVSVMDSLPEWDRAGTSAGVKGDRSVRWRRRPQMH